MSTKLEQRVLSTIEHELIKEMHKQKDLLLRMIGKEIDVAEFSAHKYKEQECYETVINVKKLHNVIDMFFKCTDRHID